MPRQTRTRRQTNEPVVKPSSRSKKKPQESSAVPEKQKEMADSLTLTNGTSSSELELRERKNVNEVRSSTGFNLLKSLDHLQYMPKNNRILNIKMMHNHLVNKSIKQLTAADYVGRFSRRITALAWNEHYPYVLASASKFGDIMLVSGSPTSNSSSENEMNFVTKAELQGGGAGYSITAMKFHEQELGILYRSSIDCTVARVDLIRGESIKFFDTEDYNRWFCGLDVNFSHKFVIAGDNKGTAYKFSLDGKMLGTWRLHKTKIHHVEFSKKDPNLMVTSCLEKGEGVRIWDVRCIKNSGKDSLVSPMKSLPHACGLNCAKFNHVDGSRLLTSDQFDEIRVYQGPLWDDYLTIKHHHKQFQHITPIKADWHPLNDYIVIGRYPRQTDSNRARAIDFFDSYTGNLVDMIYPPLDEICSLNVFNPTGEYLATGMNSKLILWKPGVPDDVKGNSTSILRGASKTISGAMRNVLRGRRAREYSPASDDDDEDSNRKKRSRAAVNNTGRKVTSTNTQKKK